MNDQLRQLLVDLSRSLYEALSESPEVGRKLDLIRQEGYSLYLLLDGQRRGERRIRLEEEQQDSTALQPASPPTFRINGQDLAFLRSIGIDPTRSLKRRGSARNARSDSP